MYRPWFVVLAVAVLLVPLPADRPPSLTPAGPLASALLRVKASPSTRVETVVDRFAPVGRRLFDESLSLGADGDLRALADALDSVGADSAAFSTDVFRFAHDGGALLPYRAIATGAGAREDGVFVVLAFAMPDAGRARDQVERLRTVLESGSSEAARRPWSELVKVERVESRGRVVLAVVTAALPTLWLSLERQPDTVVWWNPT